MTNVLSLLYTNDNWMNEWMNDSAEDGDEIFLFIVVINEIEIMIQSTVFKWSSVFIMHASKCTSDSHKLMQKCQTVFVIFLLFSIKVSLSANESEYFFQSNLENISSTSIGSADLITWCTQQEYQILKTLIKFKLNNDKMIYDLPLCFPFIIHYHYI